MPGGIATFDLATVTGWAYGEPGGKPLYGHRRNGGRPGAPVGAILADFEDWLVRHLDQLHPSVIYYEAPFLPRTANINPATVLVLYGLRGMLVAEAHRRDLAARDVNISQITKHFTGFSWGHMGRAEKKAATIRMAALYGWPVETDDEADALAVLVFAENQIDPVAARARSAGPLWAQAAARDQPLAVPVTQSRIGRRVAS